MTIIKEDFKNECCFYISEIVPTKTKLWVSRLAQLVKYFWYEQEELSWIPRIHMEKQGTVVHSCNPKIGKQRHADPWDSELIMNSCLASDPDSENTGYLRTPLSVDFWSRTSTHTHCASYSFVSLTWLESSRKVEPLLENCLCKTGPYARLGGVFLICDGRGRVQSIMMVLPLGAWSSLNNSGHRVLAHTQVSL